MRIYQGAALRRAPATRGVHGLTVCADSRPGAQMCPDVCLFEPRSPSITLANRKRSPREPARPLRPDVVPAPRAGTQRRSAAGPRQLCLLHPALRPLTPSLCPPSHPPVSVRLAVYAVGSCGDRTCKNSSTSAQGCCRRRDKTPSPCEPGSQPWLCSDETPGPTVLHREGPAEARETRCVGPAQPRAPVQASGPGKRGVH